MDKQEKEKQARKTTTKIPKQEGQGGGRTGVQVDKLSDGGAGSNSISQQPSAPSGIENIEWGVIPSPDSSI